MPLLLLLTTLFFLQLTSFGQTDLRFSHISIDEGLSHTIVNAVYQDSTGYMWFGTGNGLNRYDGYTIQRYQEVDHKATKLSIIEIFESHNKLWVISEYAVLVFDDSRSYLTKFRDSVLEANTANQRISYACPVGDKILIGAPASIVAIDPSSGNSSVFPMPSEALSVLGTVFDVSATANGEILFGSNNGLFGLSDNRLSTYIPDRQYPWVQPVVRRILKTPDGRLWTLGDILSLIDQKSKTLITDSLSILLGSQGRPLRIQSASTEDDNTLWLGYALGGLMHYRPFTGKIARYLYQPGKTTSISSDNINSVYIDRTKVLWVGGLKKGVNKADLNQKPFRTFPIGGLPNNAVYSIHSIPSKNKLIVGHASSGVFFIDIPTMEITKSLSVASEFDYLGIVPDIIGALAIDWQENLWIGPFVGGAMCFGETKKLGTYLAIVPQGPGYSPAWSYHDMLVDREGILWAITDDQGLIWFDDKEQRFHNVIEIGPVVRNDMNQNGWCIYEDKEGNIWYGTEMFGLIKGKKNPGRKGELTVTQYYHHPDSTYSISSNSVRALYESNGYMWVGTAGGGLNQLHKATGKCKVFTSAEGLANNVVYSIYPDQRGRLWLSTEHGLSCFDIARESFTNYYQSDGILSNEFNPGAHYQSPNGTIWLGNNNGLTFFHPDSIGQNTLTASPVITHLYVNNLPCQDGKCSDRQIFNGPLSEVTNMELPYRLNSLSFEISAMHFANPEKCLYTYKMEHFDEKWQITGASRRFITYTKMPPGKYIFRFNATNNDGQWGVERKIYVRIFPPFWKSTFARLMYLALLLGLIFAMRSIIQFRERMNSRLRIEQIKLEKEKELDAIKTKFFTNISHEFRTPLTLIISPLEKLLISPTISGRNREELEVMQRNAERLLRLVNQWLDFRKLETGNMKLNLSTGDLFEFIGKVQSAFAGTAAERNIGLTFDAFCASFIYSFDNDKMEKILYNLLSNAFKYTPNGGSISITARADGDGPAKKLILIVSDTGSGIPPENLQLIFERFYQVDAKDLDKKLGTGIGLSLCRELVAMHGGTIEAESEVGRGTRFIIQLPYQSLTAQESNLHAAEDEKTNLHESIVSETVIDKNKFTETILLVEDNPELRDYISHDLGQYYTLLTADNGEQGCELALREIPDLVISDVMMPLMDGIALTRTLKSDQRTSHIPIVLLTARSADEHRQEGLETGADDYIAKPFNMTLLKARIRNLLDTRRRLGEIFVRHLNLQEGLSDATMQDREFMQRAIMLIEENLTNTAYTNDLFIEQMGMSKPTLYKKLKSLTNQSVSDFIRTIRLNKAARMMLTTNQKISEIAYQVGYSDPSNFSRYFTQLYGLSPKEYMAKYKTEN